VTFLLGARIDGMTNVALSDLRSCYDEHTRASEGVDGAGGNCIGIVGLSRYRSDAIVMFNHILRLPNSNIKTAEIRCDFRFIHEFEMDRAPVLEKQIVDAQGLRVFDLF
jgi:hypothetical protein